MGDKKKDLRVFAAWFANTWILRTCGSDTVDGRLKEDRYAISNV